MSKKEARGRFAVIGTPIKHSLSAVLHTAVFKRLDLPWQTELVDPGDEESFAALIKGIRAGSVGYRGANITIPYKKAVVPLCDELMIPAARCGAVNTIWRDDTGKLMGSNSDIGGFMEALRFDLGVDATDLQNVVICGTGGVAHAIASGLAGVGVPNIVILSRTEDRATDFIRLLCRGGEQTVWRGGAYSNVAQVTGPQERFDLCVNATPLGMLDDGDQEAPKAWLDLIKRQGKRLFDVVYRRDDLTGLVRWAHGQHIPATDGLTMLIEQAIISLTLWGIPAEPAAMRVIMREALADEGITRCSTMPAR